MELHLILLILIITVLVVFLTYRSRMNSYDMYGSGDQMRPPVRQIMGNRFITRLDICAPTFDQFLDSVGSSQYDRSLVSKIKQNYEFIHRVDLYDALINPQLFVDINKQLNQLEIVYPEQRLLLLGRSSSDSSIESQAQRTSHLEKIDTQIGNLASLVRRWANIVLVVAQRVFKSKQPLLQVAYLEFGKYPFRFNTDVNKIDPAIKSQLQTYQVEFIQKFDKVRPRIEDAFQHMYKNNLDYDSIRPIFQSLMEALNVKYTKPREHSIQDPPRVLDFYLDDVVTAFGYLNLTEVYRRLQEPNQSQAIKAVRIKFLTEKIANMQESVDNLRDYVQRIK